LRRRHALVAKAGLNVRDVDGIDDVIVVEVDRGVVRKFGGVDAMLDVGAVELVDATVGIDIAGERPRRRSGGRE